MLRCCWRAVIFIKLVFRCASCERYIFNFISSYGQHMRIIRNKKRKKIINKLNNEIDQGSMNIVQDVRGDLSVLLLVFIGQWLHRRPQSSSHVRQVESRWSMAYHLKRRQDRPDLVAWPAWPRHDLHNDQSESVVRKRRSGMACDCYITVYYSIFITVKNWLHCNNWLSLLTK